MGHTKYISEVYNTYQKDIIILCSKLGIARYNIEEVIIDRKMFSQEQNPWINDLSKLGPLMDSLKKNGMYWLFVFNDDTIYEGKHRIYSFKRLHEQGHDVDIFGINRNQKLNKPIKLFYYETLNETYIHHNEHNDKSRYIYATPIIDKPSYLESDNLDMLIKRMVELAISLNIRLYEYRQTNGEEYPTSLLCNNYDCLCGAVEHYKKTKEFIINNKELTKKFIK